MMTAMSKMQKSQKGNSPAHSMKTGTSKSGPPLKVVPGSKKK
jgi:hypothetical protein